MVVLLMLILVSPACVRRARVATSAKDSNDQGNQVTQNEANDQQPASPQTNSEEVAQRININTASAAELEKLPGIGKGLAERIIEHRERFGPFRRAEHLIIVRGISDKRYRALRDLITVE
jgi:competence ComEA-like helix-hairpin-helix protein